MAKKFKFSLQPVLKYREIIESQRKKDFALANRAVDEERMTQERMREERSSTQDDLRDSYNSAQPFSDILELHRYVGVMDMQLVQSGRRMYRLQQALEDKLKKLVTARKDRRALEIIKDKRKEEHAQEEARAEQAELDALAVQAKRRREAEEK